jgi:hypothetical protein
MSEATPLYEARNPTFEQTVKERILAMPAARFFGFRFGALKPGFAEIFQPYREELSHREGFFQREIIGAVADFAAGAVAGSLLPEGWENATVDYTVKIVAPGRGVGGAGQGGQARAYADCRGCGGARRRGGAGNLVRDRPSHLSQPPAHRTSVRKKSVVESMMFPTKMWKEAGLDRRAHTKLPNVGEVQHPG